MGVYWNPANTCYYRSLERSARNVYLATQGTSGTPRVKTPTGINYTVDVPRGGSSCPSGSSSSAGMDKQLYQDLMMTPDAKQKTSTAKLAKVLGGRHTQADTLNAGEKKALQQAADDHQLSAAASDQAQQLASGKPLSIIAIRAK